MLRYRHVVAVLITVCASVSPGAEHVDETSDAVVVTPTSRTVEEFLVKVLDDAVGPLVAYCTDAVPDMKESLAKEYARVTAYFPQAAREVRKKSRLSKRTRMRPSPEVWESMQDAVERTLDSAKKQDPNTYCSSLLERLSAATLSSTTETLQRAFTVTAPPSTNRASERLE